MKSTQTARVGIIGGGLGGLAAACTLAARGYRVVLLERNNWLGGKAAVLEEHGYRFDKGPTILTMPSVLHRIFSEAGQHMDEHLELIQLDPQWRCFFSDGSVLDLRQSGEAMAEGLADFSPQSGSAEGYRRFLNLSARLNAISKRFFFWRSVGSLRDILDARSVLEPSLLRAILDVRRVALFQRWCEARCQMLESLKCSITFPSTSGQLRINPRRCCVALPTSKQMRACGIPAVARERCQGPWKPCARARCRAQVRPRCAAHPLGFNGPCAGTGNRQRRGNRGRGGCGKLRQRANSPRFDWRHARAPLQAATSL